MEKLNTATIRIDKVGERMDALKEMFHVDPSEISQIDKGFIISNKVILETVFEDETTNIQCLKHIFRDTLYPTHFHADSLQYIIVTKGKFYVKIDKGMRIMERGDCASVKKGVAHSLLALVDDSEVVSVCIPPEKAYEIKGE